MKNGEILEVFEGICEILGDRELILPVKVGYTFAKDKKLLREEALLIEEERNKIIYKYGKLEDGQWRVERDKVEECNKEINELMEIENEVKLLYLSIEQIEEVELKAELMEKIEPLIYVPMMTEEPILE